MAVSLDFLQSMLAKVQAELHEIKFAAQLDRSEARSRHDTLIAEVGNAIGQLDARFEFLREHLDERMQYLDERIDQSEQRRNRLIEQSEKRVRQELAEIKALLAKHA